MMDKKTVIYARVSTDQQAAHGYGLPTQIEGCRRYAAEQGFKVIAELADDCSGTIPISERPKGRELYKLVEKGALEAVILYTHDRTARDEKVLEYLLFKAYLYDHGAQLHYSDTGLDPYTMEGNLVGYIKAHGAASERKKILRRATEGKMAKAKENGKWMGSRPPYGYKKIGKGKDAYLEINDDEAEIVQRIYSLYLGLNGSRPLNIIRIAKLLTAEEIPVSGRGPKNARGWTDGTVRYILKNTSYKGEFKYRDIVMPFPELAIIPDDLWRAAQKRRKKNAQQAKRNRKYDYLLSGGYMRCSCGKNMVARSTWGGSRQVYFYYVCATQTRRYLYDCEERYIRADKADQLAWEWISGLLANDAALEAGIQRMAERGELEVTTLRQRLAVVDDLIAESEEVIRRLATAYAETENNTVAAALKGELNQAGKRLDSLTDECYRLRAEIQQGVLQPEEIAALREMAASMREELEAASFETKQALFDKVKLRAQLYHDDDERRVKFTCSLSASPIYLSIDSSYSKTATISARSRSCSAIRTSAPR